MLTTALKIYFAVLALVVVALILFAFRPAALIGVKAGALAQSVGDEISQDSADSECKPRGERWRCTAGNGSGSVLGTATVKADWTGCWDEVGSSPRSQLSGCINLIDVVGF